MISTRDRRQAIELIEEAVAAGARRVRACALLGLSVRTVQRWTRDGGVLEDRRPSAERPTPPNALSEAERGEVLAVRIPDEVCHRFHSKAAIRSTASLPLIPRERCHRFR